MVHLPKAESVQLPVVTADRAEGSDRASAPRHPLIDPPVRAVAPLGSLFYYKHVFRSVVRSFNSYSSGGLYSTDAYDSNPVTKRVLFGVGRSTNLRNVVVYHGLRSAFNELRNPSERTLTDSVGIDLRVVKDASVFPWIPSLFYSEFNRELSFRCAFVVSK